MDLGEQLVKFDNIDGDGGAGYGHMGTLSWADTWTTGSDVFSAVNAPGNPADFYKAQLDGKLAEITDSLFFNVVPSGMTEATNRGVTNLSQNNVDQSGLFADADKPVQVLKRAPVVTKGGKDQERVIKLDPRPAGKARNAARAVSSSDGFFAPAKYRGGFAPAGRTTSKKAGGKAVLNKTAVKLPWNFGWTAADHFGFLTLVPNSKLR